jgi:cholesterol transport system auxiliary component
MSQMSMSQMSMRRTVTTIVFSLAALVILASCGGRVRYPNYYTLNLPAPPDPPPAENVHAAVAIREFRAPAYLKQGAIVYKPSPQQIGFYAYDRWAINPCEFVTNSVIDRLRASGDFTRVKLYDGRRDIDYVLSGRLEKLEEIDYAGGVKVEVAISAQMTNLATGATVWTNSVSEVGDVNKRDVPAVVSEMNRTMERAIGKLLSPMPADVATGPAAAERH